MSRLSSLSSNPTLRNFAKDSSQAAIRRVANFLAPRVEVPDVTGYYKEYSAKHRYRRPKTRRSLGEPATRIGFEATDPQYRLIPHALDFPVPIVPGMSEESAMHHAMYGTALLADIGGLDHEAEVIGTALDILGEGTDKNFVGGDPVKDLDEAILATMKLAKNGAPIKVLFGATAFLRFRNNSNVRGRITAGQRGAKNGSGQVSVGIEDVSSLLFGAPQVDVCLMVEDIAPEGKAEDIEFLLDEAVIVFASNDTPNSYDPSFMKTFVPMGGFMVPGVYRTQDDRDEVLKMDWTMQVIATNPEAATRINAKTS